MYEGSNFSIYLHFIELSLLPPPRREESPKRIIYLKVDRLFKNSPSVKMFFLFLPINIKGEIKESFTIQCFPGFYMAD